MPLPPLAPLPAATTPAPGVLPVLPTPFDEHDEIIPEALAGQIEFAHRCGVTLVCLPAFGSEFYKLDGAERDRLIAAASTAARGRVGLVVQCNHGHARHAAALARRAEDQGAALVATALPRALPASEPSLIEHAVAVASATRLPVLLQDWNPAGPSLTAAAVGRVADRCANLAYLKLEEPAIAHTCAELRERHGDRVRVLSGWGGLYLQEQLAGGIAGVMPGLPLADVFQAVWRAHLADAHARVYRLHALLLPYIQFSLRNLEHFHHCEKTLSVRRGVLPSARVREPTVALHPAETDYLDRLIGRLLDALTAEGFARRPLDHPAPPPP